MGGDTVKQQEFQFLIGRLETRRSDVYMRHIYLFQFLIGRLETFKPLVAVPVQVGVSIPHRKARNTPVSLTETFSFGEFQFLIGRLETGQWYKLMIFQICVSIPHRKARNLRLSWRSAGW